MKHQSELVHVNFVLDCRLAFLKVDAGEIVRSSKIVHKIDDIIVRQGFALQFYGIGR